MDESAKVWLTKKRFDEYNRHFQSIWDVYIKFYTVFLSINVTSLAAVVQFVDVDKRMWIVVAFVVQNALSAATAGFMANFSVQMSRGAQDCARKLLMDEEKQGDYLMQEEDDYGFSPIPHNLGKWAGIANCIASLTLVVCWLSILNY